MLALSFSCVVTSLSVFSLPTPGVPRCFSRFLLGVTSLFSSRLFSRVLSPLSLLSLLCVVTSVLFLGSPFPLLSPWTRCPGSLAWCCFVSGCHLSVVTLGVFVPPSRGGVSWCTFPTVATCCTVVRSLCGVWLGSPCRGCACALWVTTLLGLAGYGVFVGFWGVFPLVVFLASYNAVLVLLLACDFFSHYSCYFSLLGNVLGVLTRFFARLFEHFGFF